MNDMGVLAAGNLMGAGAGIGQQLQKQIGQTGIPVYNVANACATGATALRTAIMAVKAGEADTGLAVGVEKLAGAGLLGGGGRAKTDGDDVDAAGPLRRRRRRSTAASAPRPCRACSPRSAWSTATSTAAPSFELFAKISEKNHAHSTLNPLAAYQKTIHARRDHERRHDRLPEHPADVLGQLRRRRRRGRRQRREAEDAVARAAAPGGQGVGVGAHHRPVGGGLPGPARRQHADPQRRQAGLRAGRRRPRGPRPRRAARLLRHRRARPLRQPRCCARRAAPPTSSSRAPPWRDGTTPVNVSGGLQSKGHPIAATGIANIWEVCHHLRGEAGDRQIEGAKVGLAHVIGLGSACGVHILEKSAA